MESSCFITNIRHFFLFYAENAPNVQRMRMLENYADLNQRILSDALCWEVLVGVFHPVLATLTLLQT